MLDSSVFWSVSVREQILNLRVGYVANGKDVNVTVDIPKAIAEGKDIAAIAAAVSSAVGDPVSLRWATTTGGAIIVEDTGTPVAPKEKEVVIEKPSREIIAGLPSAADGLAQLRDIVTTFGVDKEIGYTPGMSAKTLSDKLIAAWYPSEGKK